MSPAVMCSFLIHIIETICFILLRKFFNADLEQEIFLLKKEIQILKRINKKPKFQNADRFFFVAIYRNCKHLIHRLTILKPETVIKWHRKLVKMKWDYSKRKIGRPPIDDKIKALILDMKKNNPLWGARKIRGELRKLGLTVGKDSILSLLRKSGFLPPNSSPSQSWLSFLRSQTKRYWSCDFFTVETASLQTLFVFFVIDIVSREIILFSATRYPTEEWPKNVVRSWFMLRDDYPLFMVSDRDGVYGDWFGEFLKLHYEIVLYRTPPRTPNCNAFAERMVRTFREELLNHRIIYDDSDLLSLLSEFITYYHLYRPHLGLDYEAPLSSFDTQKTTSVPRYRKKRVVDGLITIYEKAA